MGIKGYFSRKNIIDEVIERKFTYLERPALEDLQDAVKEIERKGVEGMLVETGCALGGSAIVITATKKKDRQFNVYDVFAMIPPPSEKDGKDVQERYKVIESGASTGIDGDEYYGYQKDLKTKVVQNFETLGYPIAKYNVHLVEGLYEDTLKFGSEEKIALAHIDCDWYDSVMVCLEEIVPKLSKGGILVIDDYYAWSGCQRAVDDYFADKKQDFDFSEGSRLQIRKRA